MIFAMIGGSGCGKTTLAKIVSAELGIEVRHCGNAIRDEAVAARVDVASIPDQVHEAVDRKTREWCVQISSDGLVEGRFLDHVLIDQPDIAFFNLVATYEERARRLSGRLSQSVEIDDVRKMDEMDDLFRSRLYPAAARASKLRLVDTSKSTALECSQNLISLISQLRNPAHG